MITHKKICIFSSSSSDIDTIFFNGARETALLCAQKEAVLVFGGGKQGLMGECARTFKELNGKIIGIIPDKLKTEHAFFEECDEVITTTTMSERKKKMEEISDAFIALPGGFGTLEEILEIITLKQLGYHHKAIGILNTDNFYNPLLEQLEKLYTKNFALDICRDMYFVSDSPQVLVDYVIDYKESHLQKNYF